MAYLPADPSTLVQLLRWRSLHQSDQRAYTFLIDGELQERHLTYAELDRHARAIGALLQRLEAAGERALLLYPPGLDYIAAFFGCLYAGVVAVPAYPPNPARLDRTLGRLRAIVQDARPTVALTTGPILSVVEALLAQDPDFQPLRWLATDDIPGDQAEEWRDVAVGGETLAFLQYTSGSTALPKGVMLTHGNLLHNSALIQRYFGHTPASSGVIWLPPYHDMGLIGGIIQPLYVGFPVTLLSPIDFLQRPLRWLQTISRTHATTSGGPNFAYDLCVRKITPEQRAALDLGSWEVAFNGAEPIRPETLARFAEAFAPCGFRSTTFYPCYGLAEATLIVAGGERAAPPVVRAFESAALARHQVAEPGAPSEEARALVGCGQPLLEQQIVIVQPDSKARCRADQVGEIWVRGPSIAQGYWERPDETERAFRAYLADSGAGPFLRTGDLGFVREGELFITGRLKDLIIIRGRNHYPQDLELTVERSHPALRPGCGAAFAVEAGGEERLVVVQEVERQHRNTDVDALAGAIRQAVAEQHEVQVYAVVLLKTGSIPKTSSGKIQRHACRAAFLEGDLEAIGSSTLDDAALGAEEPDLTREELLSATPDARPALLESHLRAVVARVLRADPARLDLQQPVSSLGLDSLMAVELQHQLEAGLDVVVPMVHFLQGSSIAQIAAEIVAQLALPPMIDTARLAPAPDADAKYPLSHGQQALWYLYRLAPESAAYNVASAVRMRGELDVQALRGAFQALVDRHPALRTTFAVAHDEPVQQIHPQVAVDFHAEDASSWSTPTLDAHLIAEAHRPFDLAAGPLLRVSLFRRSPREHILLLVVHHIVADLWSLALLTHELGLLYPAMRDGHALNLPPPTLRYADYVHWQRALLDGPDGERLWDYWREQLRGAPPVLELSTDHPRPPVQTYRGAARAFTLDDRLTGQLKALAQSAETTLYTTLLAAFQALLHRYTGQTDLLIGSPTTGRSRAGLADVVGYFVNPVVLRADMAGNPTFTTLLVQARHTAQAVVAHQEYPLALLVERLQPQRDPSRSPLFQVMFALQKAHLPDTSDLSAFALGEGGAQMSLGGLEIESLALEQRVAQFDLTLLVAEAAAGLACSLQYNADLFDDATIARMAGHIQTLLGAIAADPMQDLATLPLLTAAERHQLLAGWNDTQPPRSSAACIHQLFAAQVVRTPDAVAVVFDRGQGSGVRGQESGVRSQESDVGERQTQNSKLKTQNYSPNTQHPTPNTQQLTYRELNERANRLAHHLWSLGVGAEVRVGVCLERSLDLVVALLGVLKAGGAYVPLDPAYPQERLAFMLEDAQVAVLITATGTPDKETRRQGDTETESAHDVTPSPCHLVTLSGSWPAIARCTANDPVGALDPTNLAYVIYTSGSTGTPKGVAIAHRSTAMLLEWARATFTPAQLAGVLASTSICFDLSVFELFVPLSCGGTVILAENALQLRGLPAASRVTLVNTVPSAIEGLLSIEGIPSSVRTVNLAGEPLQQRLAQQLYRQGTIQQVYNLYGPTEDTTYSTWALVPNEATEPPTIGRPVAATQVYLLDTNLQLVPMGMLGELYLGGAGLARGYLNRPDLTAERFIPNPFAGVLGDGCWVLEDAAPVTQHPTPNTQLYRTGDLARYRPDGQIELLGRIDQQVKVRGFRIELGEIEAVLRQHPAVRESVVLAREDAPGERRLVAYVVTSDELQVTSREDSLLVTGHSSLVTELRAFLHGRLPEYMVPGVFVTLKELPLTPNGKVDRKALPTPDQARPELERAYVAPRTTAEELLASIWSQLLGVAQIGIYDNFLDLGGHSLLATQLISRVQSTFQVDLPLRSLFETRTLAELAVRVEAARHGTASQQPPLLPIRRDGDLPLSFAQQRLWFLEQLEPGSPFYTIPAAVRLSGALDVAALARSLNAIVARHEALRTTFAPRNGHPHQRIAAAMRLALPILDLRLLSETQREAAAHWLVTAEARRPFNLARGPLIRVTLLRLGADEHMLLLMMHHIVADGWSLGVFVRELALLYPADGAALPPLPVQYVDFAHWQRAWLQGSGANGQGDKETRRQGDTEISLSAEARPPTPNTQHPTPIEAQLTYWRHQLADLPTLDLPTDHPRPPMQTFHGATRPFLVDRATTDVLLALSRREGTTLFMTLLAAWQVLLARYSRQRDIVVGSPIANRTHPAIEPLIGFFVNTLVLRADLAGDPPFRALLRRVREVCLGAYAHQDLPFEQLVKELQPERDLSRSPLFQVLFALQKTPLPDLAVAGLTLRLVEVESATAKFDLSLSLLETPEGLNGSLEYNTDLFDGATVTRMAEHLHILLEGIAADPDRRLADLPLLAVAEREQLLVAWNATGARFPTDRAVHQLIAQQAAHAPDALALVFNRGQGSGVRETRRQGDKETRRSGDGRTDSVLSPQSSVLSPEHLSYHELNVRANRLAHYLRALGVGLETRVGICLERSPELVVAALSVLKAGGAYLPMDPAYPQERLEFMLEDARVAVLITATGTPDKETRRQGDKETESAHDVTPSPPHLVTLSGSWPAISLCAADDPVGVLDPTNLAYVIYTSGSTGRPKGVEVPHRGLLNLVFWHLRTYVLTADDRTTHLAGLGFDAAVWELWPALVAGARVALPDDETRAAPAQLRDWLLEQAITISFLPTPLAEAVLALEWPRSTALRALLTGGDLLRHYPAPSLPFALLNHYGPTESSVVASAGLVAAQTAERLPSIGRPIANTQVYILDRQMEPVPLGVAGELYVGGDSLARGYANRPDLTAERFIPNPFAGVLGDGCWVTGAESSNTRHPTPNTRLYKTGDLARYLPDGSIEFLGRADQQVKIRGFRIELGEIEAVLRQHPAVRESVVLAREDARGERRLVAYIVPTTEDRGLKIEDSNVEAPETLSSIFYPLSSDLRGFLKERLPEYMLPSAFVTLEELPLTPNGKVDRKALPAPDQARPELERAYVAPRTRLEEQLAAIWAEVLGVEQVGVYDNFFHLGGHSLQATVLTARLSETFDVDLPLRGFLEAPRVADLAVIVAQKQAEQVDDDMLAQLLAELDELSEEDAKTLLAARQP